MARAFLAVAVPPLPALLRALGALSDLGRALRTVAPENLHITLQFLGETPMETLPAVAGAVRAAAKGVAAFDFDLVGTGLFPDSRRPSVIWAGARGAEPLAVLVQKLGPGLTALGFAPEDRPWVCHLTLARVRARPPAELQRFMDKTDGQDFGRVHVAAIDVMVSTLTPHGPQYRVAESVGLG